MSAEGMGRQEAHEKSAAEVGEGGEAENRCSVMKSRKDRGE